MKTGLKQLIGILLIPIGVVMLLLAIITPLNLIIFGGTGILLIVIGVFVSISARKVA